MHCSRIPEAGFGLPRVPGWGMSGTLAVLIHFFFMVMSMVWRTFSYVPFKKTRMEGYGFPPTMASLIGMNGNSGLRIMITVMGSRWEISLNGQLAGGRMVRFISVR